MKLRILLFALFMLFSGVLSCFGQSTTDTTETDSTAVSASFEGAVSVMINESFFHILRVWTTHDDEGKPAPAITVYNASTSFVLLLAPDGNGLCLKGGDTVARIGTLTIDNKKVTEMEFPAIDFQGVTLEEKKIAIFYRTDP